MKDLKAPNWDFDGDKAIATAELVLFRGLNPSFLEVVGRKVLQPKIQSIKIDINIKIGRLRRGEEPDRARVRVRIPVVLLDIDEAHRPLLKGILTIGFQ
jgi:hypothetical protein